jgi:hypothetical protein
METNVLMKEEYILKNKNKLCPYKKFPVFYNRCLKTLGSHLVQNKGVVQIRVCVGYFYYFVIYSLSVDKNEHPFLKCDLCNRIRTKDEVM